VALAAINDDRASGEMVSQFRVNPSQTFNSKSVSADAQTKELTHPNYRPDIDGLRAVAVLSVVGFHAFPGLIRGGFVGVDIFFVISGFLISTIIIDSVERGTFTFAQFYGRRIRRIFPALLVVLVACYAFGWVSLLADEFRQLGKHISGGAAFISNLVLWRESGYFDNDSTAKPLLHLWSLGIEEQFYIVWPLLLWLAWRWRVGFLSAMIALAVLSFAINIYLFRSDPVGDFYLPQARFWELSAGAILAYTTLNEEQISGHERTVGRDAQSLIGAFLLCAAVFITTQKSYFPGFWALAPVLGAVMIIGGGRKAFVNKMILSHPLLIWFGLISYPLYLWHWPLLSFFRILGSDFPNLLLRIVAIAVAIGLAWLTYRFVERPLRLGRLGITKVLGLVIMMAIAGAIGFTTHDQDGFPGRAVVNINSKNIDPGYSGYDFGFSQGGCGVTPETRMLFANCLRDSREEPRYALLGDSKAAALYGGLVRTSRPGGRWLFIGGTGLAGAPVPVMSNAAPYEQYQRLIMPAIQALQNNEHIEQVALVAAMRSIFQLGYPQSTTELPSASFVRIALDGLTNTVEALVASGKRVVLVVDNPTLLYPKDCMLRKTSLPGLATILKPHLPAGCSVSLADQLSHSVNYRDVLNAVSSRFPGRVRIFDTVPILCEGDICPPFRDGHMLYSYDDHVSDYAAGLIGEQLNAFMANSP
jgi:peptidoglycan/LPS O-acetylase OafA/YrhL